MEYTYSEVKVDLLQDEWALWCFFQMKGDKRWFTYEWNKWDLDALWSNLWSVVEVFSDDLCPLPFRVANLYTSVRS